jgi:hypothetical protein
MYKKIVVAAVGVGTLALVLKEFVDCYRSRPTKPLLAGRGEEMAAQVIHTPHADALVGQIGSALNSIA